MLPVMRRRKVIKRICDCCEEEAEVRVLAHSGYIPDGLVCEECFCHELMCWDDLPEIEEDVEDGKRAGNP